MQETVWCSMRWPRWCFQIVFHGQRYYRNWLVAARIDQRFFHNPTGHDYARVVLVDLRNGLFWYKRFLPEEKEYGRTLLGIWVFDNREVVVNGNVCFYRGCLD